ncbi:MAG: alpha-D-ribose 1-methylphosphonate 5-triphosphate diphosphatase, partial [Pseudomonadota bacterium]
PRTGVHFDMDAAMIETDRQINAKGITTAYRAVTNTWEPGLRSLATARLLVDALARVRPYLLADLRVQLRWEVFALEAVDQIEAWLALDPTPTIAFNDHFSGMADKNSRTARAIPSYAKRAGLSLADYHALTARTAERADEVPDAIERLAKAAAAGGVRGFAHDEKDLDMRRRHRALGVTVSEFPLTRVVAEDVAAAGEHAILGAPNIVRGGSHIGALDAEPAVREGLCTALASDYYYPALLAAAARLVGPDEDSFGFVWKHVAGNPASAASLDDRGAIEVGRRADICAFAYGDGRARAEATFKDGRLAFASGYDRVAA